MNSSFLHKYRNMRIRNKIITVYIPLIVIPLFLVIYSSNYIFTKSIIEKTKNNITDESKLIVTRIDGILSNVKTCASMLSKDIIKVYNEHDIRSDDPISFVGPSNQILDAISYDIRAFKDIESAAFIDENLNIITPNMSLMNNPFDLKDSQIVKIINQSGPPQDMWFPMSIRNYLVMDNKAPIITLGKKIIDVDTGKTKGFLILNIRESSISSVFPNTEPGNSKEYFILDKNGITIASRNKQSLLKPVNNKKLIEWVAGDKSINEVNIENKLFLITTSPISQLNWKLINQIPVSELTRDTYINSLIISMVGIICVIIAFMGAFFLSRLIANPIIKLTKVAKEVRGGNLSVTSKVSSDDEVGVLSQTFNEMIIKTKDLISNVKKEQKKKREFELALIQSQIKPHFLYNSLDLIYVLCEMGNTAEASETTKALADFYRVSLSKGREIITIREELKNVRDYLFIQKTRYSDILDFNIDVKDELMSYPILKMMIQPLVENSIYHGLKPKGMPGSIQITGNELGDTIILKIIDDGVGMPKGMFNQIIHQNDSQASKESFGLKSVDERIKLYFGEEYGIQVDSTLGIGTEITVIIPKKVGGMVNV